MISILSTLSPFFIKGILVIGSIGAISGGIYIWHYKPIKSLQEINQELSKDLKIQKNNLALCKYKIKVTEYESNNSATANCLNDIINDFNLDNPEVDTKGSKGSKGSPHVFKF